jgi:hypothetical protein
MNSARSIAAVTAILRRLLENGLADLATSSQIGADVLVSALPPDRVAVDAEERAQLNLFLYQLSPNTALRPPRAGAPMLALDLYYLLSAYAPTDLVYELILGAALRVLQATSVLHREQIKTTLDAVSGSSDGQVLSAAAAALAEAPLAEQVTQIQLAPQFLTLEDASRLWSTFQARYRPSLYYKVSVALIDTGTG